MGRTTLASDALLKQYIDGLFGRNSAEPENLLRFLGKVAPEKFQQADWCLLTSLTATKNAEFREQMRSMGDAYRRSSRFHPDLSLAIANYYREIGDDQKYFDWLEDIAGRHGYGEEGSTRQACVALGLSRLKDRQEVEGRCLLWQAAQYGRPVESEAYQQDLLAKMRHGTI